jgi:dihydrofolate synthase/folylpolyglutamate synthase
MVWQTGTKVLQLPAPALAGRHQVDNAGLAIACLDKLTRFAINEAALRRGLVEVDWPGRLQRLSQGPLIDRLPGLHGGGWELWLDGGHNPAAGDALAETARDWTDRPLYLVFGMLSSKDGTGFLKPLARYAKTVYAISIPGEQSSLTAKEAAAMAHAAGATATAANGVDHAIDAIVANSSVPARVLICGSLYLAGKILAKNS